MFLTNFQISSVRSGNASAQYCVLVHLIFPMRVNLVGFSKFRMISTIEGFRPARD